MLVFEPQKNHINTHKKKKKKKMEMGQNRETVLHIARFFLEEKKKGGGGMKKGKMKIRENIVANRATQPAK